MHPDETATDARDATRPAARLFTVETANAALVLVRKVVEEIVACYAELMQLRTEREALSLGRGNRQRTEKLRADSAAAIETLNRLHQELVGVGCELKDWAVGCVDFPATHTGREVWLCWQLGEPEVAFWHERNACFSNRQAIGTDFGS